MSSSIRGFTCLKNRCVPSCYILKYKLLKKDALGKTTIETTEATETNIETTTEKAKRRHIKHKKGNLKGIKKKNGSWISNKSVEWADDKTKSNENTIENVVENVYETRIESINNDYRGKNLIIFLLYKHTSTSKAIFIRSRSDVYMPDQLIQDKISKN